MAFDPAFFTVDTGNLDTKIAQTRHYLEEYEKEVQRAQGASGYKFYNKEDALGRIKVLVQFAPDDPRVKEMFERARACVKGGAGAITEVDSKFTQYLRNEEELRRHFAEVSEVAWNGLIEQHRDNMIEKLFPTPDFHQYIIDDLRDKIVVLTDVRYPDNEFMGATGDFIWNGARSTGYYFLDIGGRSWLGPYEAVKRYRRQVDTTMMDVKEWSVIARISDMACEIPDTNEKKLSPPVIAWVLEPIALYVPGHILAVCEEYGQNTGKFVEEEKVEEMKEAWYTVKDIAEDAGPEEVVQTFMTAVKEKNYKLYEKCIDPKRQENPTQKDLLLYHWDLHQERFHLEYVHGNILSERTAVEVTGGFDDSGDDAFFLSDEDKAQLSAALGEKVEEATVYTAGFDKNGKQLGSPARHFLTRRGGGRWYVTNYEVRF